MKLLFEMFVVFMLNNPLGQSCIQTKFLIQLSPAKHIFNNFEKTIPSGIIVVHQINQQVRVGDVGDDLPGLGLGLVQIAPLLGPKSKGLSFPVVEGQGVDNGGLDDLAAREDSPGDSDGLPVLHVGEVDVSRLVDHLEVDSGKPAEDLEEGEDVLLAGEELQVGLLVDVTSRLAPAKHAVVAGHTVGAGLGVDGEDPLEVDGLQVLRDDLSLATDVTVVPGSPAHQVPVLVEVPGDVVDEDVPDVLL